jgi:hypothetical protein
MKVPSYGAVKKPYEPPKLTIYGDLTQMTLASSRIKGRFDSKGPRALKTGH